MTVYCLLQENPDQFVQCLRDMGVYAYRSATQLNLVEPDIIPTDGLNQLQQHQQGDPTEDTAGCDTPQTSLNHTTAKNMTASSTNLAMFSIPTKSDGVQANDLPLCSKSHQLGSEWSSKQLESVENKCVSEDRSVSNYAAEAVEKQLQLFPHEAKYLMDHVVYLPVNNKVPFDQLDYLAECVAIATQRSRSHDDVVAPITDLNRPKLKSNL